MKNRVMTGAVAALGMMVVAGTASAQCGGETVANQNDARVVTASMTQQYSRDADERRPDILQTARAAGSFGTLLAAIDAAELSEVLRGEGPFTVFAPTDEAFRKLPSGTVEALLQPENRDKLVAILTYHVVPARAKAETVVGAPAHKSVNGQRITVESTNGRVRVGNDRTRATVTATDIMASNGVIHVIDTVILPQTNNIVEVAQEAGSFSTLLAAAEAAGLVKVLVGDGPFTVFAPTDEAFRKLPTGTVESLLLEENRDQLASILKYHVVAGRVYSNEALEAGRAETVQGGEIRIRSRYNRVMVNDARVVNADIEASNGVIHVIDTVILPGN
ncbi:MAG: fasciclin domain-containing protein [Phycisphaerales bacterium]|nr:MAG: fasciclin domain-containing protein [Phycisphaerales bacterium]